MNFLNYLSMGLRAAFMAIMALIFVTPREAAAQATQISSVVIVTNTPNAGTIIDGLTNNALSFTWTNAPVSQYQVLIGSTLAASAANLHASLNTNLPSGWTNYYLPGDVRVTIVAPAGTSQTNGVNAEWAYVYLQTNAFTSLGSYDASGLVFTNSGATLTVPSTFATPFQAFVCVAPTNYVYVTPTLATLQSTYPGGVTFGYRIVSATTNSVWGQVQAGMSLVNTTLLFKNGGTNTVQNPALTPYGTYLSGELNTNGATLHYTWLGGSSTNVYSW